MTRFGNKVEDINRAHTASRALIDQNFSKLKDIFDEKPWRDDINALRKAIVDLHEKIDKQKTVKTQKQNTEDFSSTWKQQIEMKLSRIERKLNEDK